VQRQLVEGVDDEWGVGLRPPVEAAVELIEYALVTCELARELGADRDNFRASRCRVARECTIQLSPYVLTLQRFFGDEDHEKIARVDRLLEL
jgi:hypothetical protein